VQVIKLDGQVSWHGALCRLGNSVDCPRLLGVSPDPLGRMSADVYGIAPRSVAKHYFDEHINTPSEYAEDGSLYSAYSAGSQW
jgi:hypothetical protein